MRAIVKEVTVNGSLRDVWDAWTTSEGITTFFAPAAHVELEIGGAFEMYFDTDTTSDSRGSEGCKILSYLPEKMLSFSWNAPPEFPTVRNAEKTWVVIRFHPLDHHTTKVSLDHLGWREGSEWDKVYDYFDRAWRSVLYWMCYRFENGPLDWSNGWEGMPRPPTEWGN